MNKPSQEETFTLSQLSFNGQSGNLHHTDVFEVDNEEDLGRDFCLGKVVTLGNL